MDGTNLRRWKVRATLFSPWHELPGLHTAAEIWERKRNNDFKVAVPIVERERSVSSEVAGFHVVPLGDNRTVTEEYIGAQS
jgi:hypothetical protein